MDIRSRCNAFPLEKHAIIRPMPGDQPEKPVERALVLLIRGLAWLPLPLLYVVADTLFLLLYYVVRLERTLTRDNLQRAFPDLPEQNLKRIAAKSYRNALHVLFETIHAQRISEAGLRSRVKFDNPELLDQLLDKHGKVLAVAAHQGNWEWLEMASSLCMSAPLATLYKPLNHPGIEKMLNETRQRFGGKMISAQRALPRLLRFTRERSIVAVLADQGPQPHEEKYWATFLNQDTAFYPGIEKLARILEMPLLFTHVTRTRRGHYRVRFELLGTPPWSMPEGELMERYIRAVEQQIIGHPEDWLWMYKRWKYNKDATETTAHQPVNR
ncbi:KDO2-lipid IV(A) lauroyltransferase [Thiogranum longum]|uniref:KDO2-lipid IV(A) lauroyltransferase n=1 Tax=Thiogranum longum TaxID=1537524 RepID=A0A4V2PGZ5_9GAMM|nr:lysophospholipid acyltransferase family protein [Thiogranum longum]TCK18756.1 KDO2-lipid IV(A) lauroyltransferase [Thiogranum longum]